MEVSRKELRAALRRFEHERFRPGQERVIRDVLDGRDVLAVLPTGAGKSLIYQLAAQFLPGLTIVVSPLIALMKDQVESIEEHGLEVGVITSDQSRAETDEELEEVDSGEAKLLYVTPERFENEEFMEEMRGTDVSLFVVDEAHCISEWGHDFRPAYLGLADAAERLGRPTVLAVTATATPWVRSEIVERLRMRDPDIVVRGVDRPNLFFEVLRVEAEAGDRRILEGLLRGEAADYPEAIRERLAEAMRGPGIIYTRTTAAAEETAGWLREWGVAADFYHGQRSKGERERVQDAFMRGDLRVIAATNAFGLGVDKPDVRFVIHRDVPASVEAYYQEAGRAGRDGEFARCTIIYRPADLSRAAFLAATSELTPEKVGRAREALVDQPELTVEELEAASGLSRAEVVRLVGILARHRVVRERGGRVRLLVEDFDPKGVSLEIEERRKAYERSRTEMMRAYAELTGCRRVYLLNYFGEEYESDRCDMCDNDLLEGDAGWIPVEPAEEVDTGFRMGDRVVHEAWGPGVIQRVAEDSLTVLFDRVGYKTLATALVQAQGLLRPAEEG